MLDFIHKLAANAAAGDLDPRGGSEQRGVRSVKYAKCVFVALSILRPEGQMSLG